MIQNSFARVTDQVGRCGELVTSKTGAKGACIVRIKVLHKMIPKKI